MLSLFSSIASVFLCMIYAALVHFLHTALLCFV